MADATNGATCTYPPLHATRALTYCYVRFSCATARGVDRHLLGLKLVAMEDEEEKSLGMPELFKDRAYAESSTFRLSTSNMPGKLYISGMPCL